MTEEDKKQKIFNNLIRRPSEEATDTKKKKNSIGESTNENLSEKRKTFPGTPRDKRSSSLISNGGSTSSVESVPTIIVSESLTPNNGPELDRSIRKSGSEDPPVYTSEEDQSPNVEVPTDPTQRIQFQIDKLKREEEKLKKLKEPINKKEKERAKKETEEKLTKVKADMKKEHQKLYRVCADQQYKGVDDLMVGWLQMRDPIRQWHKRWVVLRPEKLIYYRDDCEKDFLGIIDLNGCNVKERATKKTGFCWKIFHSKHKNIFSNKGLKGEIKIAFPLVLDHCIFLSECEEERANWIKAIRDSIQKYQIPTEEGKEDVDETSSEEDGPSEDDKQALIESEANTPKPERKKVKETTYELSELRKVNKSGAKEDAIPATFSNLIMSLIKQVRPGMDLSKVTLPTFILEPRSTLDKISDFLAHSELLAAVHKIEDPISRMVGIVKWYLSGFYLQPEGVKKPYNPIIGEFYRCMFDHKDSHTFYVAEQLSHHPPISGFYVSNRKEGFILNGSILFRSKFMGHYVASIMDGFATLYILPFGEEYEITFPSYQANGFLFGTLTMEIVSSVTISCKQTGIRAEIEFKSKPLIGGEYNTIEAKIKQAKQTLYTLNGKWDNEIYLKNKETEEKQLLWSPTPEVQNNRLKKYRPAWDELDNMESEKLWKKVTDAIVSNDQTVATVEKAVLEDRQREGERRRAKENIKWKPRYFREEAPGLWVYKYFNKTVWNPEEEIEEYEVNGVILSRKVKGEEEELEKVAELEKEKEEMSPEFKSKEPDQMLDRIIKIEKKLLHLQQNHSTEGKRKLFSLQTLYILLILFFLYWIYSLNSRIIALENK